MVSQTDRLSSQEVRSFTPRTCLLTILLVRKRWCLEALRSLRGAQHTLLPLVIMLLSSMARLQLPERRWELHSPVTQEGLHSQRHGLRSTAVSSLRIHHLSITLALKHFYLVDLQSLLVHQHTHWRVLVPRLLSMAIPLRLPF